MTTVMKRSFKVVSQQLHENHEDPKKDLVQTQIRLAPAKDGDPFHSMPLPPMPAKDALPMGKTGTITIEVD